MSNKTGSIKPHSIHWSQDSTDTPDTVKMDVQIIEIARAAQDESLNTTTQNEEKAQEMKIDEIQFVAEVPKEVTKEDNAVDKYIAGGIVLPNHPTKIVTWTSPDEISSQFDKLTRCGRLYCRLCSEEPFISTWSKNCIGSFCGIVTLWDLPNKLLSLDKKQSEWSAYIIEHIVKDTDGRNSVIGIRFTEGSSICVEFKDKQLFRQLMEEAQMNYPKIPGEIFSRYGFINKEDDTKQNLTRILKIDSINRESFREEHHKQRNDYCIKQHAETQRKRRASTYVQLVKTLDAGVVKKKRKTD